SQLDIHIEFSDDRIYEHVGKIDFIDNRVNQNTGTLAIRADFPNPNKILLPGQYTRIQVSLPNSKSMLLIPQAAVQEDQQGRFVLVVNNEDKVEKRMVTLGNRHNVFWEVEKGLEAGEKIIIDGLQKVRVGIQVETSEQTDIPFAPATKKSEKEVK
ncbi:MAG: efflux RND transporter periplasmic adaptor subunit, partial [Psychromonas sp.]|nr:efflux RND transporter periplasmic adaptor subunit [Psychromonas sp.]